MKLDSLKAKVEFDFIYKNAKRFFHKHFMLYALKISHHQASGFRDKKIFHTIQSREAMVYLGLSVSRKIGKANKRNLLKRRIRAIIYENREICKGFIFIVVARDGITSMDFMSLQRELLFAFSKIQNMFLQSSKHNISNKMKAI